MPRGPKLLSAIFTLTGVLHFVVPKVFESIVPSQLPAHRALVYGSGVAELGCALGLATNQRWARLASAGVLLGVWPANIEMAVAATRDKKPWWYQAGTWGRVPLQVPMIRMALSDAGA